MKKLLIGLLFGLAVMITACDVIDDSPCGIHETFDMYLLGSSIVDTTNGYYYSYIDGTNRVFQWSQIVEQVCPEEHVNTTYRVALLAEDVTGVEARGRVSWYFFYEDNATMTRNGSDIEGSTNTGLKQAFGTDPGWYVPTLEVFFPTKGSYSADTAFLKENVISVEVMSKYRLLN
jgi:hypothetical protein